MFSIDLIRFLEQQEQMKATEWKLNVLADNFDRAMLEVNSLLQISGLSEMRRKVKHRMEEHQDGFRQIGNAAIRAGEIYRQRERMIEENCDGKETERIGRPDWLKYSITDPEIWDRLIDGIRFVGELENPFEEET